MDHSRDHRIRSIAFEFLARATEKHGDVLPFAELSHGLEIDGARVPLLGPKGIFKPRIMDLPLSITTSPDSPYNDTFTDDGLLQYRFRGTNPNHPDNQALRNLMQLRRPLIYLHGVAKGRYLAAWPVYIVGEHTGTLTFDVAVVPLETVDQVADDGSAIRRRYVTAAVRVRLHQRTFRERVLAAYHNQCALCRIRHRELLDAAHIRPDSNPNGEPVVTNGLSLCKLHHAAFDQNILGVRPDYVVEIRHDILDEVDGPMLRHGLQEMNNRKLIVPRSQMLRPDPDALAERYELFRAA